MLFLRYIHIKILPSANFRPYCTDHLKIKKNKDIRKKFLEFQNFIKNNFENVGDDFAYKARSIHFDRKKTKGIYGNATKNQIKELHDEGIETHSFPWIEDKKN